MSGAGAIPTWAVPGARIVCIAGPIYGIGHGWERQPVVGEVYTVREVEIVHDIATFLLTEIHNERAKYRVGWGEICFAIARFRPPVTRTAEQDVAEHFQRLLSPANSGQGCGRMIDHEKTRGGGDKSLMGWRHRAPIRIQFDRFAVSTSLAGSDHPVGAVLQNLIGNSRVGAFIGCRPPFNSVRDLPERRHHNFAKQFHSSVPLRAVAVEGNQPRKGMKHVHEAR